MCCIWFSPRRQQVDRVGPCVLVWSKRHRTSRCRCSWKSNVCDELSRRWWRLTSYFWWRPCSRHCRRSPQCSTITDPCKLSCSCLPWHRPWVACWSSFYPYNWYCPLLLFWSPPFITIHWKEWFVGCLGAKKVMDRNVLTSEIFGCRCNKRLTQHLKDKRQNLLCDTLAATGSCKRVEGGGHWQDTGKDEGKGEGGCDACWYHCCWCYPGQEDRWGYQKSAHWAGNHLLSFPATRLQMWLLLRLPHFQSWFGVGLLFVVILVGEEGW